ncbi:hypothetical protein N7491_004728 [Penicillium cf. griseofulvum]|uniref:PBSP domain-containing protein n=1 Tax=Penicillium cf. griseofulvum TaxID=2972120 RepID=A0A9W9J236_9EURO|nr:hypothetical protein N7472_007416 [Penicillium cf. griseofulvum]KAJ5434133.1 hypothetical protein N7491_004728 [Penicillium cf. griseofulvum]KAJ5451959.1 hypothetical protein N7445_000142 [Penicillium cf. griseofulvum]
MASTVPAPHPSAVLKGSTQQEPQTSSKAEKQRNLRINLASSIPQPKLRLHVQELRHPASSAFLALIPDVASTLNQALANIIKYLYTSPPQSENTHLPFFTPSIPPTRSVTVFLRDYSGVAYTTGTELDDAHKEIHISLPYIQHCTSGPSTKDDPLHELVGVLTHELVHCYQHTTPPSSPQDSNKDIPRPPGGLIEGIADFVRLKAGLEPPHWERPLSAAERPPKWDMGYQHTAYFLAWIEDVRVGRGAVGMLNDRLLRVGYVDEEEGKDVGEQGIGFWKGLFGVGVGELWEEYGQYLDSPTKVGVGRSSGNWEDEILNPE